MTADTGFCVQAEAGWEEYYDYIFPDDESNQPHLRLLEMAKKWATQKKNSDSENEGDENSGSESESEQFQFRASAYMKDSCTLYRIGAQDQHGLRTLR